MSPLNLTEGTRVVFPPERITVHSGNSFLESCNVRFLSANITPGTLEERINPLFVTVAEVLPVRNGQVEEPLALDWKMKRIKPTQASGVFVNFGTHVNEAGASAVGMYLRDKIAAMNERPGFTVFSTGLGNAFESLRAHEKKQEKVKQRNKTRPSRKILDRIENADPNRKFITPFERPEDPMEELCQNYLAFIYNRYALCHLDYFDIHKDPQELDIQEHLILDWLDTPKKNRHLYEWAKNVFPNISIVWDLEKKQYLREKLNRCFPAKLMALGINHAATFECEGVGDSTVTRLNVQEAIISGMVRLGVVEEERGFNLLSSQHKQRLEIQGGQQQKWQTVNQLLDDVPARRVWVPLTVPQEGIVETFGFQMGKLLHSGDELGWIQSTSYPPSKKIIRVPKNISNAVLFGRPNEDILNPRSKKRIYFSLAVPQTRF